MGDTLRFCLLVAALIPGVVIAAIYLHGWWCQLSLMLGERAVWSDVQQKGRTRTWESVSEELRQGNGTLVIHHTGLGGPVREWWTPINLIESAPVPLPRSLFSDLSEAESALHVEHSMRCRSEIVDVELGSGLMTHVPKPPGYSYLKPCVTIHLGGGWMTAVPLVLGRRLKELHPNGRIVTLIDWGDDPFLAEGDAEDVLLQDRDDDRA